MCGEAMDTNIRKTNEPAWVVVDAVPRRDHKIELMFASGEKKLFDARPLLEMRHFTKLNNIGLFMLARVECGSVVWNDDIDIAPEHLYEASEPI